jgi:hypothetical protein
MVGVPLLYEPKTVSASDVSLLRIDTEGIWYYGDTPLERLALVRLFYTVLNKQPDGYYITTPVENVRVEVEDAPYTVVAVEFDGQGQGYVCVLNDETTFPLDELHPLRMDERGVVYVVVRQDTVSSDLEARVNARAFLHLVEQAQVMDDGRCVLRSYGHEILLGRV